MKDTPLPFVLWSRMQAGMPFVSLASLNALRSSLKSWAFTWMT